MHAKRVTPLKNAKRIISLLFGLVGLTFLLFGCGQAAKPEATTEADDPTGETVSIDEMLASVAQKPDTVDYCVECHADKDKLIDTAAPEEEAISENEGEG
ncbi:MAG: hypothetical protein JXB38_12815 [Anaerolineales bacterium]|nr:hypothetical protein [Anaerolineales bacterium]